MTIVSRLERGLAVHQEQPIPALFPSLAASLGAAYAQAQRVSEALPLVEQAVEQSPSATRVRHLGEVSLQAGRVEPARRAAERALGTARQHRERSQESWTLRLLGEIAARAEPDDSAPAERYYRQALALAEELGMRPLAAHCHLGLGALYQQVGRDAAARAERATAAQMYRAMEMPFWLEKAEASDSC